jgi:phosphoserine phosphatase
MATPVLAHSPCAAPAAGEGLRMTESHSPFVVVLIGPPGRDALDQQFIATAAACVSRFSAADTGVQIRCLSPGNAYEVQFYGDAGFVRPALVDELRALAGAPPADLAVLPAAGRRKRLLVADMESTIIEQECLDELADHLGLRARVAAITERAMRGELEFDAALRARVALLAGLDAEALAEVYRGRVTLTPGAERLIATMRANGAICALVSGGFDYFTERIAKRLAFDAHQANRLDVAAGRIAGTVGEPILGRQAKLEALLRLSRVHAVPRELTMAVGDGANDLAMIGAAGLGVAFHARPIVAEAAAVSITHGDLSALLYLQGYGDDELISPAAFKGQQ